jgi:hypothetical protein
MANLTQVKFDPAAFLAEAGLGRRIVRLKPRETFFSQGDAADCFFMNRFRKLGFIDYNGGIKVHKSLLNVVLHD